MRGGEERGEGGGGGGGEKRGDFQRRTSYIAPV